MTTINATLRDRAGKGTARATRRAGNVPVVVYGNKQDPIMLAVNTKEIEALSRKAGFFTQLFEVKAGKDSWQALARDAQRDPVTEALLHVDFMRVDPKTRIKVGIPVKFINGDKAPGIKRGGVLNIVTHEIDLWVSAVKIPHSIDIDLTGLEINDSIHSATLSLPEGTEIAHKEEFTVATIAAPSAIRSEMKEQADAAKAAAAAPAAEAAAVSTGAPSAPGQAPGAAATAAAKAPAAKK